MLLVINTGKKRNGMTDHYKGIINEFSDKKRIIAVVPSVFTESDFPGVFRSLIVEDFSDKNKIIALFKGAFLAAKLRKNLKKGGIRKVFLFFDNDWFNILINIFFWNLKISYYVWIHDPVLHSGEGYITKAVRFFNTFFLYRKAEKVFVSYNDIKGLVSDRFSVESSRVVPLKLPQMRELEFEDLRKEEACLRVYEYDVIFYGRIEEYKGIDLFIDSVDYIKLKYGVELKVLIAGTGDTERSVHMMIEGKSNYVFLNRYIENRELAGYIINSKIVVMPYKDATGTSAIQVANYYNKPVVASRVGCFPEYIEDGLNGLLIDDYTKEDLAVKIYELIKNKKLYREMKRKIPLYFKDNFDVQKIVKALEKELDF